MTQNIPLVNKRVVKLVEEWKDRKKGEECVFWLDLNIELDQISGKKKTLKEVSIGKVIIFKNHF